ncbi:MAG: SGNH/GDSL hydrolase family protein [Clostridia bacterium]|nr:SGNH/GDSL hydrolase family protein [Clostridia bacterium]
MDLTPYLPIENEKPLDRIVDDGGLCAIFRTIACIGDSLSSGEFESTKADGTKGYHDYYEYSWGQYIARMTGAKVYNFSKGGMTAKEYLDSFADRRGLWAEEKASQAYIMALGVNDLHNKKQPLGQIGDIVDGDWRASAAAGTFAGWYGAIIQRYRAIQPKSRFFFVTMPRSGNPERDAMSAAHAELLYQLAEKFDFAYVIDLHKYAPVYDAEFKRLFYLGNHMNAAGYLLTARMVASYIDYIVRNKPEDFTQVGFIGTPHHNAFAKW